MKKKTTARVISQDRIQESIYDLRIETDLAAGAHAGQFVGVYTHDRSKLLPRPISICEAAGDCLRLVYRVTGENTGTADISGLRSGDSVDILGILGNGYDVGMIREKYSHPVLMGGGIGIPPMLQLAGELTGAGDAGRSIQAAEPGREAQVSVILGYRDSNTFLVEDFEGKGARVYIATEDGSIGTKGNVLDVMRENKPECDVILACGPMPMLRGVASYARENGIKAYISLEERMACGVGACLGCVTRTKETDSHSQVKNARICTEGPVFDADMLW